jgi:hypothetical protein
MEGFYHASSQFNIFLFYVIPTLHIKPATYYKTSI